MNSDKGEIGNIKSLFNYFLRLYCSNMSALGDSNTRNDLVKQTLRNIEWLHLKIIEYYTTAKYDFYLSSESS